MKCGRLSDKVTPCRGGVRGKIGKGRYRNCLLLNKITEAMTPAPKPIPVLTTALDKHISHYNKVH
jgi:hypothetical protein